MFPRSPYFYRRFEGGRATVRLNVAIRRASKPIALGILVRELEGSEPSSLEQALEEYEKAE